MKIEIDKPVVPQFIAEWIEKEKECTPFHKSFARAINMIKHNDNWENWEYKVGNRWSKLLATAWIHGYEVESEQKYNVKFKVKSSFGTVGIFLYKEGDEVLAGDNFKVYYPKEDVYRLTEQEIRDFQNGDILFEHFAVKVDEAE